MSASHPKKTYKKYDAAFKAKALQLALTSPSILAAARELNMNDRLLYRWYSAAYPRPPRPAGSPRFGKEPQPVQPARLEFRQRLLNYLHEHELLAPRWQEWSARTGISASALRHYVVGFRAPTLRIEQALQKLFPNL